MARLGPRVVAPVLRARRRRDDGAPRWAERDAVDAGAG